MDKDKAIGALKHLGLTSYEAQVFIALQKLGVGSASEIDRIADVPRSQVYGAAETLEELGLAEVQQSNPIRYRPVALEEARERLQKRYEQQEHQAFDYLEEVTSKHHDADEHQEDVWTLHGRDTVSGRTRQLIDDAEEYVLYGGSPEIVEAEIITMLVEQASNGVSVTIVSATDEVLDYFEGIDDVTVRAYPTGLAPEDQQTGRILIVDDEIVLLSILGDERLQGRRTETAIWSAETGFAAVIIRLINAWFEEHLE